MLRCHTMANTNLKRITITVPDTLLAEAEALRSENRSKIVQNALRLYIRHLRSERLRREAEKIQPAEESALAEEAMAAGNEVWSDY